jgi:hypothetical protein
LRQDLGDATSVTGAAIGGFSAARLAKKSRRDKGAFIPAWYCVATAVRCSDALKRTRAGAN